MTKEDALIKLENFKSFLLEKEEAFKVKDEKQFEYTQDLRIQISEILRSYSECMDDIINELK